MHKEVEEKVKPLCKLSGKFTEWVEAEASKGRECLSDEDVEAIDKVVDWIKDLYEAEEKCWKSHYYKTVVESMKEAELYRENGMRMGYNTHHSSRTGRFISGYHHPMMMPMREEEYMMEYMQDPDSFKERMGYGNGRMGATRNQSGRNISYGGSGSGYTPEQSRYGMHYNHYDQMRRHYHETHSDEDKHEMDEHAKLHVEDSIATIKDIWRDADPTLKRKMKADFTNLVSEMTV